ncbi:MAG: hypothetical protein EDM74_02225 [Armatimonadetes bacterium]|nr:MAG: hypothetical protein EDM74_02225 [Armatimonadota bacterium]
MPGFIEQVDRFVGHEVTSLSLARSLRTTSIDGMGARRAAPAFVRVYRSDDALRQQLGYNDYGPRSTPLEARNR